MSTIGFKNSLQRRQEAETEKQSVPTAILSETPQQQALLEAVQILRNYFDPYYGPMQNKEEFHFAKLRKLKERYFDRI